MMAGAGFKHNGVDNDNSKSETARTEIMYANKTGPKYIKSQEANDNKYKYFNKISNILF